MTTEPLPAPSLPAKRYFAIGEVAELCGVKPHVLRYWEQEFPQLKPNKRRGNRRYYQHDDVMTVLRIRGLLYDEGYSITAARTRLRELPRHERVAALPVAPRAPQAPAPAAPAPASRAEAARRLREEAEALLRGLD